MSCLVFFNKTVLNCHDQDRTERAVLQVFALEGRIYCEMESLVGNGCCAQLTPSDAKEIAHALSAAASFVEGK
jgi:hypothetical protein